MEPSVPENWPSTNNGDDFDEPEVLEMDSSLLISLLQDSEVENGDDERLLILIKSLEAEIEPTNMVMNDNMISSLVEPASGGCLEDCQPCDVWQLNDQDCSISHNSDLDFSWVDDVEMVSSAMGDYMDFCMYMDPCSDDDHLVDNTVEFGEVGEYSYHKYSDDTSV